MLSVARRDKRRYGYTNIFYGSVHLSNVIFSTILIIYIIVKRR